MGATRGAGDPLALLVGAGSGVVGALVQHKAQGPCEGPGGIKPTGQELWLAGFLAPHRAGPDVPDNWFCPVKPPWLDAAQHLPQ